MQARYTPERPYGPLLKKAIVENRLIDPTGYPHEIEDIIASESDPGKYHIKTLEGVTFYNIDPDRHVEGGRVAFELLCGNRNVTLFKYPESNEDVIGKSKEQSQIAQMKDAIEHYKSSYDEVKVRDRTPIGTSENSK